MELFSAVIWANDLFVGSGASVFWNGSIAIADFHHDEMPKLVKFAPFICAFAGIITAYFIYLGKEGIADRISSMFSPIYLLFKNKWYFDQIYSYLFIRSPLHGAIFSGK